MLLDIASHITKQYPTKRVQRVKVMLKYNDNVIIRAKNISYCFQTRCCHSVGHKLVNKGRLNIILMSIER